MKRVKKKKQPGCRGCGKELVVTQCWPNDDSRGWKYLICERAKCPIPATEKQGVPA